MSSSSAPTGCQGMKAFCVVNPWSSAGKTERQWPQMQTLLETFFGKDNFQWAFSRRKEDAIDITRKALKTERAELIIAIGGDGTLNEVVNGFFEESIKDEKTGELKQGALITPNAQLAYLAAGTGGDFSKTVRVPRTIQDLLLCLKRGKVTKIDTGFLRFHSSPPAPSSPSSSSDSITTYDKARYFVNMATCGVGGQVDQLAERLKSPKIPGALTFFLASFWSLIWFKRRNCRVRVDNEKEWSTHNISVLSVCNGQYFGAGMRPAPTASVSDAMFELTIWTYSFFGFLVLLPLIYSGGHVGRWGTTTKRVNQRVEVIECEDESSWTKGTWLDVDGEAPGCLPACWDVVPSSIQLLTLQ